MVSWVLCAGLVLLHIACSVEAKLFYDCKAAVLQKMGQGTSGGKLNSWQKVFAKCLLSETAKMASGGQGEAEVERPCKRQRAAALSTYRSSSPPGPSGATFHSGDSASYGNGRLAPAAKGTKLRSNTEERNEVGDEEPQCDPSSSPPSQRRMQEHDGSEVGLGQESYFPDAFIQTLLGKHADLSSGSDDEEVLREPLQATGHDLNQLSPPFRNPEIPLSAAAHSGPSLQAVHDQLLTLQGEIKEQSKKINELAKNTERMLRQQSHLIHILMARQEAAQRQDNDKLLLNILEAISRQNSPFSTQSSSPRAPNSQ